MSETACSRTPTSRRLTGLLLLAAFSLTSGCATRESLDLPDLGGWQSRQSLLGQLDEWAFNGRIGVIAGDDGFSGSLRWTQEGDDFEATVSGPLGIGTVRLEGDGSRVQLIDKDGNRTVLEDAERDLYLRYGWTIPVRSLRYWALGIPDPELPAETEMGGDGQLQSLTQGGWQVDITRYGEGGGQPMPTRLRAASEQTRVKLAIHKWSFFDQSGR
ncbi:MAG: lipoprotein insertase outer membrane protein LolB [Gammaproteobacteria bacterium]|jgi:outer membrane lipoprotein LolB|nr:lipoprotein insertase outer membrane protein LolB [Gammaproteobacteria bacterium]MDH3848465.1 lipoprotein insertase outer membrane protein LolB [Gammaproteobacteria bacterium]MDH3864326.1 lipoprotein insertase outer membrane protein LolB [Gammaproteobacteria bacterium]MDH3905526.1 lipoprotein insertase outer membrane protein LolB [Gammaproteobacteria bacterium]MDH4005589.1 lipoprotein insertase outer membrane protein LolB [Gammaproteobacteria bacterium]